MHCGAMANFNKDEIEDLLKKIDEGIEEFHKLIAALDLQVNLKRRSSMRS